MRVIEEILKQCDQSTTAGFNAIENSISNTDVNNNNNKNNNKLPQIGDMLHFSKQQKTACRLRPGPASRPCRSSGSCPRSRA